MPNRVNPSRILLIDAYDSFSNNIISLLETRLEGVKVTTIKVDEEIPELAIFLHPFDAVVAGPGPGHPDNREDVGLISQLWQLKDANMLPILGICLGFQSLVTAFGGSVVRLPAPRHGIVRNVTHHSISMFRGLGTIAPVQYHSLHAEFNHGAFAPGWTTVSTRARPSIGVGELELLAWDFGVDNQDSTHIPEYEANPEAILMAVKHKTKPFYGVQFHPESICSDASCRQMVANWWSEAQQWNQRHKTRRCRRSFDDKTAVRSSSHAQETSMNFRAIDRMEMRDDARAVSEAISGTLNGIRVPASTTKVRAAVISRSLPLNALKVPQICRLLKIEDGDAVLLDSEPHIRADVGSYSVIGALEQHSLRLDYHVGCAMIKAHQGHSVELIDLRNYDNGVFGFLKAFMDAHRTTSGNPNVPFWGGLIGYIGYEACLETLSIKTSYRTGPPDISFVFVERSVVIDHQNQQIHIQSIKPDDDDWVSTIASNLPTCAHAPQQVPSIALDSGIIDPDVSIYKSKIRKCQDYIHSGDSYELCLTNQAYINTRCMPNAWPLYLKLRSLNAAPFSAYIRLGGLTLLSSSPERFMRWTRPVATLDGNNREERSTVQFRPIKGTVKRYPNGPDRPAINLEQATALLSTPKERAENLMIVDLIRHDLHGVVGSGKVCVPKLMVVEEYATLFQLVTVVEGTLINQHASLSNPPSLTVSSQSSACNSRPHTPVSPAGSPEYLENSDEDSPSCRAAAHKTGIDVLAASLPPGSMTGAPKRRSCALLHDIEGQARGIYSGIVGYMDVGGGGDFSVVIRSASRWKSDTGNNRAPSQNRDRWTVGAGGAITSLSTEDGEWEEMMAKLASTRRMFV
ncbi:MAG: hypothetical protein Q9177_004476 [Variospora cf. flavescens]